MLKSWKVESWKVQILVVFKCRSFNFSTFSTFFNFQHFNFFNFFNFSTFQLFNFLYKVYFNNWKLKIESWTWKLKSWKVESWKVENVEKLKCWENIKSWKVEMLKSWKVESWKLKVEKFFLSLLFNFQLSTFQLSTFQLFNFCWKVEKLKVESWKAPRRRTATCRDQPILVNSLYKK